MRHGCLMCMLVLMVPAIIFAADESPLQYNRDIRPILADKCFRCHGPDAAARQAELRLDEHRDATADRGGYRVIKPRQPAKSELIRRITTADDDERMPPRDSGSVLSENEVEILRRWIAGGAEYQPHWAFIPPRRPPLPEVKDLGGSRRAIDRFIFAKLEREGLRPSMQADAPALIRRVTLALTGLPPTLEEVDAFQRDSMRNPEAAFDRLAGRLLASPRFGERMALAWLDAARYADTNGYFTDNDRTMWPWRDWVIGALNDNMPFDQFTIEQLAGDLLPNSTIDQKIATGFNRNHMVNNETGIIEEEFRVEYVVDRVDTTATVWMGLTLACARCHDHKYDPISQKDFYRFFSFFNNVPERGLSGSSGNAAPFLKVPTVGQLTRLDELNSAVKDAEQQFSTVKKKLDEAQRTWEKTAIDRLPKPITKGLVAHYQFDADPTPASKSGSVTIVDGMLGRAAKFAGDGCIHVEDTVDFDGEDAFSFGAWIQPAGVGCVISKMDDADDMRGFDVTLRKGKAVVNLVHRWNRDAIRVATSSSVPSRQWQHLMVTYDGSRKAKGVKVYFDGEPQPVITEVDLLAGSIRNGQPLRIGRRRTSASYSGLIDDVRLYARQLTGKEVHTLASNQLVRGIVTRPPAKRSKEQQRRLRAWFVQHHADQPLASASDELDRLRARQSQLLKSVPTTMVMQESEKPRQAFLLVRGQYDQQGDPVAAGVPRFLQPSDAKVTPQADRLALAKWLVDPSHPLTARVTVNRLWQQLFGTGLVKTADDFGTQGDWPSHPELLDWLAVELVESGWDIKHLLRLIVTSATYRQSSHCSPELLHRDRENRLLARGPRFRMDAEMLRDNALATSGLLIEKIGGPSVKPYQPAGLWQDVTYDSDRAYGQGRRESLYRRSLYTFWKRQSPPPNMQVFDAPTRETCTVQRSRTNTPLQALALMNDPTFVEASRKLAERTMTEATAAASGRVTFAFRAATARRPDQDEVRILLKIFHKQKAAFDAEPDEAAKLLGVGESKPNGSLDPSELAAWTTVASMILSLDETITSP